MDDRDEEIRHTIFEGMRSGLGGSTQIKNTLFEKYIILPRASVEVVENDMGKSVLGSRLSILADKLLSGKDVGRISRIIIVRE